MTMIKNIIISLTLFAWIGNCVFASSIVDITDVGVGARVLGLGSAFTAIADDASAIFTNPAGLTYTKTYDLMSMGGNMLNEVPCFSAGGTYKIDRGVFGIGYVGASVAGIYEATLVNGTPELTGNTANYSNKVVLFSYATKAPFFQDNNTRIGANLKFINYSFSGAATFDVGSATGFDLDLGTIVDLGNNLTGAVTVKNAIPGNNIKNDEIPMSVITGIGYRFPSQNILTAIDFEMSPRGLLMHGGVEWWIVPYFSLRGGLDQASDGMNFAMGLGAKNSGFTFDYAYHTYAGLSDFSTHFLSIGYIGEEKKPAITTIPTKEALLPLITLPTSEVFSAPIIQRVYRQAPAKKIVKQIKKAYKTPLKKKPAIVKKPIKKKSVKKK